MFDFSMSCCPENSLPAVPTTHAVKAEAVGNTTVFVFDHPSSDVCMLVLPDIFGTDSGRTKELCADLSQSYKVVLVDIAPEYISDPSKLDTELSAWILARPFSNLVTKLHQVVDHFRSQHNVKKFAAIGFCWGAWVVAKYSAAENSPLMAGISFHPSWAVEQFFHGPGSGAQIASHIRCPQLVLTAGNDKEWLKPGGDVAAILKSKNIPSTFREFPDMVHGWVNRGDVKDSATRQGVHRAWVEEALPFLETYVAFMDVPVQGC